MDPSSPQPESLTSHDVGGSSNDIGRLGARFRVERELGSGAFAKVLLCVDSVDGGRTVAVKVMHAHLSSDVVLCERFKREAEFAKRLSHPNLVSIYDFGRCADGSPFMVMEYVNGTNLREYAKSHCESLCLDDRIRLLEGIAEGLRCAHEAGLTHRDIKPDNILIDEAGTPRISDFGVAKAPDQNLRLTITGDSVGTPVYMSPEQFAGTAIDARTDVYSFGIVAYELLTGSIPFVEETYQAMANAHLLQPMPFVVDSAPHVPRWLDELVQLCTQKDPAHRYQSMDEILSDIRKDRRSLFQRILGR